MHTDTHTYTGLTASKDKTSHDWHLMTSSSSPSPDMCGVSPDARSKHVLATRLLDTEDPQDRAIRNEETPIIWAWGEGGVGFHGGTRGSAKVNFFAKGAKKDASSFAHDGVWTFKVPHYPIPGNKDTT